MQVAPAAAPLPLSGLVRFPGRSSGFVGLSLAGLAPRLVVADSAEGIRRSTSVFCASMRARVHARKGAPVQRTTPCLRSPDGPALDAEVPATNTTQRPRPTASSEGDCVAVPPTTGRLLIYSLVVGRRVDLGATYATWFVFTSEGENGISCGRS